MGLSSKPWKPAERSIFAKLDYEMRKKDEALSKAKRKDNKKDKE